jgi:hypothetical protein
MSKLSNKTAVVTGAESGIGVSLQNARRTQMSRKPVHLQRSDWATDERLWKGVLEGKDIVRASRALFSIGEEKFEATAGQILLGPANVPHKFTNLGPGLLETTDIHVSDEWIQTDLDDPEFLREG